jgi:hypothetical protein
MEWKRSLCGAKSPPPAVLVKLFTGKYLTKDPKISSNPPEKEPGSCKRACWNLEGKKCLSL